MKAATVAAAFALTTRLLVAQPAIVPEEAVIGDSIAVCVAGDSIAELSLTSLSRQEITRASALTARMTPAVAVTCFLAGIDTTVDPGEYRLIGYDSRRRIVLDRPITLIARDFAHRSIPLNAGLSELRTRNDPRKVEESRVLTDLILTSRSDGLYHLGPFAEPLANARMSATFGDRRTYRYADGETATTIHVGLDLVRAIGTPVHSSGRGVVRMARSRIITGNTVVVEHLPGVYSLYYHLDELAVVEGEWVETGDTIGTVGSTGLATGPHLHWEMRVSGTAVEPSSLVGRSLLDNL
jgi:murein DD-endopeptidase MepM/ murein hydrolase activator NlpD